MKSRREVERSLWGSNKAARFSSAGTDHTAEKGKSHSSQLEGHTSKMHLAVA